MKRRAAYRYRSAVTGRYVSAAYAKRHPKETVRETVWALVMLEAEVSA